MIAKRLFLNHSPSEWFSFIQKGAAADPHRQQHLDGIAYFASAKAAALEPAMRPQVNALEMVKPM